MMISTSRSARSVVGDATDVAVAAVTVAVVVTVAGVVTVDAVVVDGGCCGGDDDAVGAAIGTGVSSDPDDAGIITTS